MINTDLDWYKSVRAIADDVTHGDEKRRRILEAAGYLWDSSNWERLHDTIHGKFLREMHNEMPDLLLRSAYRTSVIKIPLDKLSNPPESIWSKVKKNIITKIFD